MEKEKAHCPHPKCKFEMHVEFTNDDRYGRDYVADQRFCPNCNSLIEFRPDGFSIVLASANSPIPLNP